MSGAYDNDKLCLWGVKFTGSKFELHSFVLD